MSDSNVFPQYSYSFQGDETALSNVRRVVGDSSYVPSDPTELCNRVLVTCYMGSENSSEETKNRAKVRMCVCL